MLGLPPSRQGTWQLSSCFVPFPNRASVVGTKRAIAITIRLKIERLRSIMVVVVVVEGFVTLRCWKWQFMREVKLFRFVSSELLVFEFMVI